MSGQYQDHPGIAEGYLSDCEREATTLRRQLAIKERELQRLLIVQAEQAAEIEQLTRLVAAVEAAASV